MKKNNLPRLLGIALAIYFTLHAVFDYRWIESLEAKSYDWRLAMMQKPGQDERVVIIDIDEKSLAALGRWPWSRDVVAKLVDTLYGYYGIKVIGFDVVFAEPDIDPAAIAMGRLAQGALRDDENFQREYRALRNQFDRDGKLAAVLKKYPVVMGFVFEQGGDINKGGLPDPWGELPEEILPLLDVVQPQRHVANLDLLQEATQHGGFFDNPTLDEDGVFRRVPLIQVFNGGVYPSLALATASVYLDNPPFNIVLANDEAHYYVREVKLGDADIPLGRAAAVLVPYRGGKNSFPYVSAIDVIEKKVDKAVLEGRASLLGTSAPGLLDLRTVPLQKAYPGVEVHANIIAGIIDGNILHQPNYILAVEFLLLVFMSLVLIALSALSPGKYVVLNIAIAVFLAFVNYAAWNARFVLPLMSPFLLQGGLFVLFISWGLLVESKEKKAITRLFGQYVPPELVDEMAEHPEDISLEGQNREMTVLFSDVRGFTTISEGLQPRELTQLMNDMLTPMTAIIHKQRGTIDKYMGDAIMAFWGAPLEDKDHALHALKAALQMVQALPEINKHFAEKGWPEINVGVGLNTGEMNVGNMGSQFRMAYTVLGDAVNLGSRLEGLTKQYGVNIIISESTKAKVPDVVCRELDRVRVKGKDEPVTIYEPVGFAADVDATMLAVLEQYHAALELYRAQQWDKAMASLIELNMRSPHKVHSVYMQRIDAYKAEPPGANWDGVFTHTSK